MLCTMMSLGELAVMYPVNGGYYEYSVRFLDPSWFVLNRLPKQRAAVPSISRPHLSPPFTSFFSLIWADCMNAI